MFVIENTDIICRSCVNIFNTMDRLMLQLANLGNTILNYLEEKYSLIPGEIFQTAPPLHVVFKKGNFLFIFLFLQSVTLTSFLHILSHGRNCT